MSLGLLPLLGLVIAQVVLKLLVFAKKFVQPLFLLQIETSLIEWCDNCVENLRRQELQSNMDYVFR